MTKQTSYGLNLVHYTLINFVLFEKKEIFLMFFKFCFVDWSHIVIVGVRNEKNAFYYLQTPI